jgi:hypothetical protein
MIVAAKSDTKQQAKKNVFFFIGILPQINLSVSKHAFTKNIQSGKYVCYLLK